MKPASSFANIPLTEMLRRELSPVKTRRKLLVAVSGGSDSVALLHLLLEAGYRNLMVAHFNHRLRGSASRGDALS